MSSTATILARGAIGSRPAAGSPGHVYFSTEPKTYRDNGSSWDDVSDAGTAVTDATISTTDVTTNNVSTSKHGWAPKAPNDATKYLDGTGAYSVPSGGGGGSGALVFLEAHTASSSATLDFTTFISSTYDDCLIEGANLVPATNAQALEMQIGTGGGPTYDTGSNYYHTSTNQAFYSISGAVANNAGYGQCSFSARLFSPQSTAQMKQLMGQSAYHDGTFVTNFAIAGLWATAATAVTAVRFKFASGNIASGVIRIYGISKS